MHSFKQLSCTRPLHDIAITVPCSAPLHGSAPWGLHPYLHSSPCCATSPAPHQPCLSLDFCIPAWLCAKYSINHDIKRLAITLVFFWASLCHFHLKESMDRFSVFPWHYSLPSLPSSFQSPCALQHTVVGCCATLCLFSCGAGKEQLFKFKKKKCLSFLKPLDKIKENVIFLPPSLLLV